MKKTYPRLLLSLVALLVVASHAHAQGLVDAQRARTALTTFPDSQAVLFLDVRRTLKEALPLVMPPAELEKNLSQARKVGFDPNSLEYMVVGLRLADTATPRAIPDIVVLIKGNANFSADALLTLARLGISTQGMQTVQETYNTKTLEIVTLNKPPATGETATPPKYPVNEVAATALDASTIVVGVPSYVRAVIDAAASGQGRLSPALVDLSSRNPTALSSLTVVVPESLPNLLQTMGVPMNGETAKFIGWVKRLNLSSGMTPLEYNLRAAIQTDSAEHAGALSGLVRMGLTAAEHAINEDLNKPGPKKSSAQAAANAIKSFTNTTQGDIVLLGTSVPQKLMAELLKQNTQHATPSITIKKDVRKRARGGKRPARKG
ncbi:MAG: hypothetical protein WCD76_04540 [Pyrinomonadaceae bacterium]